MKRTLPHLAALALLAVALGACQTRSLPERLVADDTTVREKALLKIQKLSPKRQEKLVPPLMALLRDEKSEIANRAARALGAMGEPAAPALAQTLADPDVYVRVACSSALSQMGPGAKSALPALLTALNDPHPLVREQAALAVGRIGQPSNDVATALQNMARADEDVFVRQSALQALQTLSLPLPAAPAPKPSAPRHTFKRA